MDVLKEQKPIFARKSGIDLLRILAILMICIFHANQTFRGDFEPEGISKLISFAFFSFGPAGNVLFIICSAYFLVDKPKARGEKAIHILADSSLISILILIGFLICQISLDRSTIIHQIVPDLYKQNWFVPCYVIFYLLAPVVVAGLKGLSKQTHFGFSLASIFVYGLLSIYEPFLPVGSSLLQFFFILNLVAFIKWHIQPKSKRWNFLLFFVGTVLFFGLFLGCRWFAAKYPSFYEVDIANLYSPFLMFPLIGLFNLFRDMKFSNRVISYLSTCSLFVYVIHENYLLRSITRKQFYIYMVERFGIGYGLVFILLCGIGMFFGGFILAVVYNETLHRLTKKLSTAIWKGITIVTDKIYNRLFHPSKQ